MAEPIKPVSRLEDASLGNSQAIAEARRATSSERQSMAVERSMQRQYRRAVRKGDMQTISVLGSQMSDMGLSRTGGGGIQDSQENNRIASDRAFNRADQLNQAAGRGGAAPESQKGAPHHFAPNVGQGAADDIEAAAGAPGAIGARGTNGQTGTNTVSPNSRPAGTAFQRESKLLPENNPAPSSGGQKKLLPRAQFIADLKGSELIKNQDSDAIERAAKRGADFGIGRDQIEAFARGGDATPSGAAKEKADALASRNENDRLSEELVAESATELKDQAVKLRDIFRGVSSLPEISAPSKYGPQGDIPIGSDVIAESPIKNNLAKVSEPVFKPLDPKSADYWNVDPESVAGKKTKGIFKLSYEGDRSDPRYPVMRIKAEAIDEVGGLDYSRNRFEVRPDIAREKAIQETTIRKAINSNLDISDYARASGPDFYSKYQKALESDRVYKRAAADLKKTESQVSNLFAPEVSARIEARRNRTS